MRDIHELFAEDPLNLTREDITQIVAKMREFRKTFQLGNLKAGSTKAPTARQSTVAALLDKVGDLGL